MPKPSWMLGACDGCAYNGKLVLFIGNKQFCAMCQAAMQAEKYEALAAKKRALVRKLDAERSNRGVVPVTPSEIIGCKVNWCNGRATWRHDRPDGISFYCDKHKPRGG